MEGDFIKINHWLKPLSWLYGFGVGLRNFLFDEQWILKTRTYDIPIISVGNITVGGSGKTPHVEYLVSMLRNMFKVAVLSRGYKRKTKGFLLADQYSTMPQIGDEPYQMLKKFPNVRVAVDSDRCHGIDMLLSTPATKDTDVILLDDAFQHRYVKPGINILLVDYHRLIVYDELLPAGRLREPCKGKDRADIVIITKCPTDLKPMDYRVLQRAMRLMPFQKLYFTAIEYGALQPIFVEGRAVRSDEKLPNVLLITGIASPEQLMTDLKDRCQSITPMHFDDHHDFTKSDVEAINLAYKMIPKPATIITTEKDATRLENLKGLSQQVRRNIHYLPIRIIFLEDGESDFNQTIINYVQQNRRNSTMA